LTPRPRLTVERTYRASAEEVWELWTTREGIEAWWGPDGFSVAVRELELQPGGDMLYVMTATGADQVEYMLQSGMPLVTEHRLVFTAVDAPRRLGFMLIADFISRVEPYAVHTLVERHPLQAGVRTLVTFDAMHDERWTQLATMGRESELRRLQEVLAARS